MQRAGLAPEVAIEHADRDSLSVALRVPEELGVWPGHFPMFFVVPGVLQLGWVMALARERLGVRSLARIEVLKFAKPMRPGDRCSLSISIDRAQSLLAFRMEQAGVAFSSGRLRVEAHEA